ncbi:glyceraldehyde 3-phosphate dehydrogenase (phosphorylating) [Nematocida sp. AWRm77]|nr:glyceraldehyde 3-phosphate dehydrogenase (phosphorylating) [Nematocida sp. AWRm77]
MKVGINGAGRIGKLVARVLLERQISIGCINDPFVDAEYLAYLLARDSTHGPMKNVSVTSEGSTLVIERKEGGGAHTPSVVRIAVTSEKNPADIKWGAYGVEYVVEASGVFTTEEACAQHLTEGVKTVVITAPSKDAPMFVVGVNCAAYSGESVISNASCTTNCLAPIAKVLEESFGVEEGLMSTIHALTASQKLVDGMAKKSYRDGRSGVQNIIPASTGAAAAIGKVIPSLAGKLTGMSFRVPVPDVSVVDLTVRLRTPGTAEAIKEKLRQASENELKGILRYTEEAVVSSDFIGESASSVFDATASMFLSDTFVKLVAWYDNEYGYSNRVADLLLRVDEYHKKSTGA